MEQEINKLNKKYQYIKDNKDRFYDPTKTYKLRESLCNKTELMFYNIIRLKLHINYVIFPQINLQSIIDTNTYFRNNELYRNIDFCIFKKDTLKPVLAIELNGNAHNDLVIKKRDLSIRQILKCVDLPLLTIKNNNVTFENFDNIYNDIEKIILKN